MSKKYDEIMACIGSQRNEIGLQLNPVKGGVPKKSILVDYKFDDKANALVLIFELTK